MNRSPIDPFGAEASVCERLLAELSIRIELPPSKHRLAVERYEAVSSYIQRKGSPLEHIVDYLYPQGSMAIGATIIAKRRDDGYDIDIVCELDIPRDSKADFVLDLLFCAIRGEPGSRYYDMVERQTRCITIYYSDGMHLDLTPSILIDERDPRKSNIFHAKQNTPEKEHFKVVMNSAAFIEFFRDRTPIDHVFEEIYRKRTQIADPDFLAGETEDVPFHAHQVGGKSVWVVSLQLLKRNRNVNYAKRMNVRMPPSVMFSALTAEVAQPGFSITESLMALTKHTINRLRTAHEQGVLLSVVNPRCPQDCFTDRWPENRDAQWRCLEDMCAFERDLLALQDPSLSIAQKERILGQMFGESPARSVIEAYGRDVGRSVQSASRRIGAAGGLLVPASPAVASGSRAPRHTFFGGKALE